MTSATRYEFALAGADVTSAGNRRSFRMHQAVIRIT